MHLVWKSLSPIPFLSLSGEGKKDKIEPSLTVHRGVLWCVAARNMCHYKVKSNSQQNQQPALKSCLWGSKGWRECWWCGVLSGCLCWALWGPAEPPVWCWSSGTCWAGGRMRPSGPALLGESASREEGHLLGTNQYWRPGWWLWLTVEGHWEMSLSRQFLHQACN